jgi:rhamnogalacturonan acetylesterase
MLEPPDVGTKPMALDLSISCKGKLISPHRMLGTLNLLCQEKIYLLRNNFLFENSCLIAVLSGCQGLIANADSLAVSAPNGVIVAVFFKSNHPKRLIARRLFVSLTFALFCVSHLRVLAQDRGSSEPPPQDPATKPLPQPSINPVLPTIFIIGDSTAHLDPDRGWGSHLWHYFDLNKINVVNRAIAARSSRSYIDEGSWDKVLPLIKPGDYVLLQWGHNDASNLTDPKPWKGTGTLHGLGDETKDVLQVSGPTQGKVETIHTFGWYMRRYISDIRAKGATPILLTLTIRDIWNTNGNGTARVERDMGYDNDIRKLGETEHVAVADMANIEANKLEEMGRVKAKLLFPNDDTHTSPVGAELNAQAVVKALEIIKSPLVAFIKIPTNMPPVAN